MAGPRPREGATTGLALDGHDVGPLGPLAVSDCQSDGAAQGHTRTDAGQDLELVALYLHPWPTPVSVTSTGELVSDRLGRDVQAGRETLEDRDERGPMRFARS